jgi:hypothetical protein
MTTQLIAVDDTLMMPRYGRQLFWLNAIIAWCGVVLSFLLNVTGYYNDMLDLSKPTILGNVPSGIDSPLERILDWLTYFTILSNIVVAIVLTVLVVRPGYFARTDRVGAAWRALRLDSILMIVITGVVYNLLLAEGPKTGWDFASNSLQHIITPIVTVIVWLFAGPRGLINIRVIGLSMILPLAWALFAILRGAVVGSYPYPFLDVSTNGLVSVVAFVLAILVVAVILAFAFMGLDALFRRMSAGRRARG